VECRDADPSVAASLSEALDEPHTRAVVAAERALLATLEAGCSAPVGALADVSIGDDGDEIYLRGVVADIDGSRTIRLSVTGPLTAARELGTQLAADLLQAGAADLIGTNP
jgi:hydroxymethylbilane synthase